MYNGTVLGLDEAGRGALAGPLFAAGVLLDNGSRRLVKNSGLPLRDGKTLNRKQRAAVAAFITARKITYLISRKTVRYINNHGVQTANITVLREISGNLPATTVVADGTFKLSSKHLLIRSVPQGDCAVIEIMLAGILAKHYRDEYMVRLSRRYPLFGFDRHAGYGTRQHLEAIKTNGMTKHHRTQFVQTALFHLKYTP